MRQRGARPRNSLAGARYEPRLGPPLLQGLAQAYDLPEPLLRHWWRALCAAQWSEATAWREALIAFHPDAPQARAVWETACSPAAVVHILEVLVAERTLTRQAATGIEDVLLPHVGREGEWQRGGA